MAKEVIQGIDTTILSSFVQPVERDATMPVHAILPVPGQMIPPTLQKLHSQLPPVKYEPVIEVVEIEGPETQISP